MTALQRALIALGVLAIVVSATVVLTVTGNDASALLGWLIPIVTGVWGVTEVTAQSRVQNHVLAEISDNVNGKLDARIHAAVRAELDRPIAGPYDPDDRG